MDFAGRLVATTPPGAVVGSAKSGTPWARKHLANRSMAACCAADGCGGGRDATRYLLHPCSAFWKAGPLKVIPCTVSVGLPGVAVMETPCPPGPLPGSGKFEIPCARMHCDKPSGDALPLAVVAPTAVWPPPEEPQAPMATAQPAAAIADASRKATAPHL